MLRLLLDTHAFIWWFSGDSRLSIPARRTIADETNEVLISAASAWEITTKHRLGKLPSAEALGPRYERCHRWAEFRGSANYRRTCRTRRSFAGSPSRPLRPDAHRPGADAQSRFHFKRITLRPVRRSSPLVNHAFQLEIERNSLLMREEGTRIAQLRPPFAAW